VGGSQDKGWRLEGWRLLLERGWDTGMEARGMEALAGMNPGQRDGG
jgi:hypothetical protein